MANINPFGAFAEGVAGGINAGTQGYLQGRQFRQQEAQHKEQLALQREIQTWQRGIGTLQTVLDGGKQFKDPISKQNYYNTVLSDDFAKQLPQQLQPFASAFKNMPAQQQADWGGIIKELNDMAQKGDVTNFPITMAKAWTYNKLYDAGGDEVLKNLQSLHDRAVGKKSEQEAIDIFTKGVATPSGYVRPISLSPTLDLSQQGLLTGQSNLQESIKYTPATEGQELSAISNLPKDSKLTKILTKEGKEFTPYHVSDDYGNVYQVNPNTGKSFRVEGAKGKTKDTTGQEYKLDEKTLRIKKQAAGLAAQELSVKYGRDVMAVDPVTGMSGVNPNYGTPEQRNTIFREWQTLTNKHLPQSLKTELPKEASKPSGQRKPLSSFQRK